MKKVGRPTGLIAYDTDENVVLRWMKQKAAPFRPFRPRIVVYAAVFALTAGVMTLGLATRSSLDLSILKDRGVSFVRTSSGEIRNAYTLKLVNKQRGERELLLLVDGLPGASLEVIGQDATAGETRLVAAPDGVDRYRLLVTAPQSAIGANGSGEVRFTVKDPASGERAVVSATFAGPEPPP
jgi:polyferredoxin